MNTTEIRPSPNDVPALAQKLRQSIARNLTYRVDQIGHVPAGNANRAPVNEGREGLPVGRLNGADAWHPGLDAVHYDVNVDAIPLTGRILLKDGDRIIIDADKGTIDVDLPEAELAARRAAWSPRGTDYNAGALWKYAQLVGPAHLGAVTHPGGAAETHVYADI